MKLARFKVMNFKSIECSGWIDCEDVTTLVGVNEAGKSNLILALWKLKPARGGEIDILHDMPTSKLGELRTHLETVPFVTAEFVVSPNDIDCISEESELVVENLSQFEVTRYYDGHYKVEYSKSASFKYQMVASEDESEDKSPIEESDASDDEIVKALVNAMPSFVYYSNYGNLSSRVYLPHAMRWINGEQVEGVERNEDQVRTLKVLFEFVHLSPKEILELGKDPKVIAAEQHGSYNYAPSQEQIAKSEAKIEERRILLNSAGSTLTEKFHDWWKQGEYIFRLDADGSYFTIWVSDKKRPTEVELSNRSTGLQWFLSFFLVFLVEAQNENKDAILLLDEAGLSLHPKAQHDLIAFFNELSKNNQLIHTTHSPFLIDTNEIDRCVAVYVDENGNTVASNNLRDGAGDLAENSIYAVHAALGLNVSDVLLSGCYPVIVEGPSDQFALSAIKQRLVAEKLISPKKEIVFLPAGGNKGVSAIASVLGMKDDLPPVILDGDKNGIATGNNLRKNLYKEFPEKLISIKDVVGNDEFEIEDLIPFDIIERRITRLFIQADEEFGDTYKPGKPIVPQIENFAEKNEIHLQSGKWKVDLAKYFKRRLESEVPVDEKYLDWWKTLFEKVMKTN